MKRASAEPARRAAEKLIGDRLTAAMSATLGVRLSATEADEIENAVVAQLRQMVPSCTASYEVINPTTILEDQAIKGRFTPCGCLACSLMAAALDEP